MTKAIDQSTQRDYRSDIWKGIKKGTGIMLFQCFPVNWLNQASVASCYHNTPPLETIKRMYQRAIGGAEYNTARHLWHCSTRGLEGHLGKEFARVGFKASGIVMKPSLDAYFKDTPYGKIKADVLFAGGLAAAEMFINPADTLKTLWQVDKRLNKIAQKNMLAHLYKGSMANGLRQFFTWFGYPLSERMWSTILANTTSLDPHLILGIIIKSLPQSFQITFPVWMFERLKNELQYQPEIKGKDKTYRYVHAFKQILKTQGWIGFANGFQYKMLSNWILIIGTNYLLEQGRAMQKVEKSG